MFFITTIRVCGGEIDNSRTVGYYKKYDKALSTVVYNICDIFEDGYYQYALISRLSEGLYPTPTFKKYFKYTNGYVEEIAQPEEFNKNMPYIIG